MPKFLNILISRSCPPQARAIDVCITPVHRAQMTYHGIFEQYGCLYFGALMFGVRPSESFINQNFPKLSFYPVEDKEIRVSNKMLFD